MPDSILIGPSRAIKSPMEIPLGAHDAIYVVEPGVYPVKIRPALDWKNVTIEGLSSMPPLLTNGDNKEFGIFQVAKGGSLTLRGLDFDFAGNRSVVAETRPGAMLRLERITQNQGCLFWGRGGVACIAKNCQSMGKPWKYYFCNFNEDIGTMELNNSELPEASRMVYGGVTESPFRVMKCKTAYFKSIIGVYSLDSQNKPLKDGAIFQFRSGPDSEGGAKFCLDNCSGRTVYAGWMEDPALVPPTRPIESLTILGGTWMKVDRSSLIRKIILSGVKFGPNGVITSKTF